jgi:predicted amidophosphoribosyltransferase
MKKGTLIPAGVALLIVGVTVALMWPARRPKLDPKDLHYMYCPACERDWEYKAEKFSQGCQRCGGPLEGTKESIKTAGARPSPYSKLFAVVLLELVVAMGVIVALSSRGGEREVEYLYTRCPKCNQKLRYREEQIGNIGKCRRCLQTFAFPEKDPNGVFEDDEP